MNLNASKTKIIIVSRSRTIHPQSPLLTISLLKELYWRCLMIFIYREWHLIQRRRLRSIYARFPEQPLNGLVSCKSIDRWLLGKCFLGFVLPVLQYCSAVWCSAADTHLGGTSFLGRVWVWHCTSSICGSIMYHVQDQVWSDAPSLWSSARAVCAMAGYMLCFNRTSIFFIMRLLAAEPRSSTGLLFSFHYLCGTILVTQYSIVWDVRVSRAGPMPFYLPSCLLHFRLILFSLSLHSMGWLCGAGVFGLIRC